ncbi:MAG: retroviral-like aspartic protease family protein [Magnetococcales bacterium]|nr:retroviral-like aspartic protease family protein [Magnetococcales bacterium]
MSTTHDMVGGMCGRGFARRRFARRRFLAILVLFFVPWWPFGAGDAANDLPLVDPTRPDHVAPPPENAPPPESEKKKEGEEGVPTRVEWKRLDLELLLTSDGRKVAVINGRRFMEGDVLDSGPVIESITDDAVVVVYGGEKRTLKRRSCFTTGTMGTRRSLVLSETCSPKDTNNAHEVPLIRRGRTLYISAILNGTTAVEFVLDTGATTINIPRGIALELVDSLALTKLPTATTIHAAGQKVKEKLLKLESVQVGSVVVKDIPALIGPPEAPALLGMTVLDKLGAWHIDNRRQLLIIDKS